MSCVMVDHSNSDGVVNTMQQRGSNQIMDNETESKTTPPLSRGRHNSKLKFLIRSHAMREETSPPRDPSPNLISPSIKVIPSEAETEASDNTTNPIVVLSPSISDINSPCRTPICASPTSTLVPSPSSRSPSQNASPNHHHQHQQHQIHHHHYHHNHPYNQNCSSDDYDNTIVDEQEQEQEEHVIDDDDDEQQQQHNNQCCVNKCNNDVVVSEKEQVVMKKENTSHNNKKHCDNTIIDEGCTTCAKNQERNINNNLTNISNNNGSSTKLTVTKVSSRGKLKQQSSSQGSFDGGSSNSPCLSRDSSCEQQYTDTSGTNLEQFIPETLNRNAKDRAFMLRIEQELVSLAKDKTKTHFKFPPMSSYQRMLVHRCAAYFGMEHNIEQTGKCVVVNKTKNTRIPDKEFKEHIQEDLPFSEEPRRSILKRDSNSIEDYNFKSSDQQFNMENRRSKSFEEREEEYEKVRRRIFNRELLLRQIHDGNTNDDFEWAEVPWSSTDSDSSRFRLQLPDHHRRHGGKLIKGLSEETSETLRPQVAKSHSFGDYGHTLSRGDSLMSTHSAGPRLLTKQDSGASSVSWRLSPSSSGYKSQSQLSESITPSPTSTPHLIGENSRQDSNSSDIMQEKSGQESVVWCVTDIQSVPKGSIIINPNTGEYIKNEDGSLYHYDPNNPPPGLITTLKPPISPKKSTPNSPQRSNTIERDHCQSPKKHIKHPPNRSKSQVTNSSTSPSLPYSPPLSHMNPNRNFQIISNIGENIPQQFPVYSPGFTAAPAAPDGLSMYQQPCIVYTPYGVPMSPHFDNRIESGIPDGTYYVNIPESGTSNGTNVTFQQSAYWNQQAPLSYYPNSPANTQNTQRFPVAIQTQQSQNFMPPTYSSNFVTQPPTNPPPPGTDLVPVFPSQQVQVIYSTQPNPPNSVLYTNQPIVYTQNPVYPPPPPPANPMYPPPPPPLPPQGITQYPQSTSTPNSCTSSVSHTGGAAFTTHVPPPPPPPDLNHPSHQQNVMQLTQNLAQMTFVPPNQIGTHHHHQHHIFGGNNKMIPQNYEIKSQKNYTQKNNKFHHNNSSTKPFIINSSQSSTGTNSPATTVVASYGPQNIYRTPSETPPSQFGYPPPNYQMPPMLFRQMSNVRANTPGTNRSSRSPTPASEIHFDKQRIPLPPTIYHGLPYVIQSPDNRVLPGRNQQNIYRQQSSTTSRQQQNFNQCAENRSHKTRKSNK